MRTNVQIDYRYSYTVTVQVTSVHVEKFIYRILNIHMCVHIVYQIIKLFFISQRCIGDQHPDCTQ